MAFKELLCILSSRAVCHQNEKANSNYIPVRPQVPYRAQNVLERRFSLSATPDELSSRATPAAMTNQNIRQDVSDNSSVEIWLDKSPSHKSNPLTHLQSLFTGLCLPQHQEKRTKSLHATSFSDPHREIFLVPSCDTDDDNTEATTEEEVRNSVVVVTKCGTSRTVRVYRGLETFLAAVLVVYGMFYMLQRFHINVGLELQSNAENERSLFAITKSQS